MYIIIAGGGVVGRALVRKLMKNKHDLVVIDSDRDVCEAIYSNFGVLTICGNATRIDILQEAGIDKCDAALGVMGNDADNLAFSILSKNYNIEQILVRMREPEYRNAYRLAGASKVAGIVDHLVDSFVNEIEQPQIQRVVSIEGGRAEISIVNLPPDACCAGHTISEIVNNPEFPEECVIAGIFDLRERKLIIPRGQQKIYASSRLFLVGTRENIKQAADYLTTCR